MAITNRSPIKIKWIELDGLSKHREDIAASVMETCTRHLVGKIKHDVLMMAPGDWDFLAKVGGSPAPACPPVIAQSSVFRTMFLKRLSRNVLPVRYLGEWVLVVINLVRALYPCRIHILSHRKPDESLNHSPRTRRR